MTKHRRWTQATENKKAHFPENKYGFSQHLTTVGDWVQTNPIPYEDYIRIRDAAKNWAYYHGVRVNVSYVPAEDNLYTVTIRLVSYTRKREDATVYDVYQMLTNVDQDQPESSPQE